jgi:hypothetical protein
MLLLHVRLEQVRHHPRDAKPLAVFTLLVAPHNLPKLFRRQIAESQPDIRTDFKRERFSLLEIPIYALEGPGATGESAFGELPASSVSSAVGVSWTER